MDGGSPHGEGEPLNADLSGTIYPIQGHHLDRRINARENDDTRRSWSSDLAGQDQPHPRGLKRTVVMHCMQSKALAPYWRPKYRSMPGKREIRDNRSEQRGPWPLGSSVPTQTFGSWTCTEVPLTASMVTVHPGSKIAGEPAGGLTQYPSLDPLANHPRHRARPIRQLCPETGTAPRYALVDCRGRHT